MDVEDDLHDEEEIEEEPSRYDRFESERKQIKNKREFGSLPTSSKVVDLLRAENVLKQTTKVTPASSSPVEILNKHVFENNSNNAYYSNIQLVRQVKIR